MATRKAKVTEQVPDEQVRQPNPGFVGNNRDVLQGISDAQRGIAADVTAARDDGAEHPGEAVPDKPDDSEPDTAGK